MTGRGIDQVLPYPGAPHIYESHMKSAAEYVTLAERKNGPIPKPVDFSYIWGDALDELDRMAPDARVINLETAVTKSVRGGKWFILSAGPSSLGRRCSRHGTLSYSKLQLSKII